MAASPENLAAPLAQPGPHLHDPVAFDDPLYREAVVDLLGVLAYGEISAFERLAEDSKMAPTLEDKVAIATMAAAEFSKVARIRGRLEELGLRVSL